MQNNNLRAFPKTLGLSDFGVTANVTCQAGQWNKVGTLTVPAQQMVAFGANDPIGGASIAGTPAYINLVAETGTALTGKIRLAVTDANELNTKVIKEDTLARFASSETDRTKAVLLPLTTPYAKEDSKLLVLYYPPSTSAETIDFDGTGAKISIPVTVLA